MYDVQFAASTYVEGGFIEDMDEAVRQCAEAGFAGVEVDARSIAEGEGVALLREMCYKYQIAPVSAVLTVEATGRETLGAIKTIADHLERLGAECLVLKLLPEEGSELLSTELPTLVKGIDEEFGIRCSLEIDPNEIDRVILNDGLNLAVAITTVPGSVFDLSTLPKELMDRVGYLSMIDGASVGNEALKNLEGVLEEIDFTGWIAVRPPNADTPIRPDLLRQLKTIFKT